MSDLQCAATLLLARNGEAAYETEAPTDDGGSLTPLGREQARELGESLGDARLATIYTSTMSGAVQTAEIVAGVTGAPVMVREGLREWPVGEYPGREHLTDLFDPVVEARESGRHDARTPGSESAAEIRARVREELETIADLHRGETVLVVSHAGALQTTLPPILGLGDEWARTHRLANGAVVEVAIDADGWALRSWPSGNGAA